MGEHLKSCAKLLHGAVVKKKKPSFNFLSYNFESIHYGEKRREKSFAFKFYIGSDWLERKE